MSVVPLEQSVSVSKRSSLPTNPIAQRKPSQASIRSTINQKVINIVSSPTALPVKDDSSGASVSVSIVEGERKERVITKEVIAITKWSYRNLVRDQNPLPMHPSRFIEFRSAKHELDIAIGKKTSAVAASCWDRYACACCPRPECLGPKPITDIEPPSCTKRVKDFFILCFKRISCRCICKNKEPAEDRTWYEQEALIGSLGVGKVAAIYSLGGTPAAAIVAVADVAQHILTSGYDATYTERVSIALLKLMDNANAVGKDFEDLKLELLNNYVERSLDHPDVLQHLSSQDSFLKPQLQSQIQQRISSLAETDKQVVEAAINLFPKLNVMHERLVKEFGVGNQTAQKILQPLKDAVIFVIKKNNEVSEKQVKINFTLPEMHWDFGINLEYNRMRALQLSQLLDQPRWQFAYQKLNEHGGKIDEHNSKISDHESRIAAIELAKKVWR